jgi:2-polyprenyl-3-methyl-5-hydroxy-6-metoxy-1,4-benzoquinol methylase
LELSKAAIAICNRRGVPVRAFDLERDTFHGTTFDVAVSLEVAEHLPQASADGYVDLLTSLAPVVILSAAPPGQHGVDHVNEQPRSYWIAKFQARSYDFLEQLSRSWSQQWRDREVAGWYRDNVMIFRRNGGVC